MKVIRACVKTKCPECNQEITFMVKVGAGEDGDTLVFYDDSDRLYITVKSIASTPDRLILDCSCGKDFIAKVELEAHVTTRKIAETEEGEK